MAFEHLDSVERVIYNSGFITVKQTVQLGRKHATNGTKLSSVYTKSFASQKYADHSELTTLHVRTDDYLIVAYNDFENRVNESILISYPHMVDFINFLGEVYNLISQDNVYTQKGLHEQAQDVIVESEPLVQGKVLAFQPDVTLGNNENIIYGGYLFFNDDNVAGFLDVKSIMSLYNTLSHFDFYTTSNQLITMAMLEQLSEGGVGHSAPAGNQMARPATPAANRPAKFGNRNNGMPARRVGGGVGAGKAQQGNARPSVRRNNNASVAQPAQAEEETITSSEIDDVLGASNNGATSQSIKGGLFNSESLLNESEKIDMDDLNVELPELDEDDI